MIGYLKGQTIDKEEKYLVLETSGVGYKVYASLETIQSSPLFEQRELWIHHVIREDASDLYGFSSKDALKFFEMLITVSGIGPKTALGILNATTVGALKRAISTGDTSHLVKVGGIGKKNADKIVLELKGKFDDEGEVTFKEEVDALEALKAMGFDHKSAREALKDAAGSTTEERVRYALKSLGR